MNIDAIKQYYALCSISRGINGHIVGARINSIFTQREIELLFEKRGDAVVVAETVIGAGRECAASLSGAAIYVFE